MLFDFPDRIKDSDRCHMRCVCDRCDSDCCNDGCMSFFTLELLLQHSNIPSSRQTRLTVDYDGCSDKAKTYIRNIILDPQKFVFGGYSIYLHGKTGVGKSTLATKILLNYLFSMCDCSIPESNCRGMFVPVSDIVQYCRSNKDAVDFDENMDILKKCDLLVLDNIFDFDYTSYVQEILSSIIRYRVSNSLSIIYTSNLSPKELNNKLPLFSSLVCENGIPIEFKGDDHRLNAEDFDKAFGGDV